MPNQLLQDNGSIFKLTQWKYSRLLIPMIGRRHGLLTKPTTGMNVPFLTALPTRTDRRQVMFFTLLGAMGPVQPAAILPGAGSK